MAQLDVSDLLLDPDFVDPTTIIRRTTSVNDYGENIVSEPQQINTICSVQPANFKQLQRLPEALRMADVRSFFIKIEILQDKTSAYPDIILFQNQRYEVQTSAPWLNYGGGWCEAIAVRQAPS